MPTQLEYRISSQIQRVVRDGAAIFEKRYVTNSWDDDFAVIQQRARQEVEMLRQIANSHLFDGRLGVVRIAEADPIAATISTCEVTGRSLEQFIHNRDDDKSLLTPWFLAGRWLRQFQILNLADNSSVPASRRDPTDIVDYCDLRLRSLVEYGYPWPTEAMRGALLQSIETLQSQCADSDSKQVWVHADYAPGNLMWDGRVLTPIDFAMVRAGTALEDATYLIHRLEMQKVYRPWLRFPVSSCRSAILRGLGRKDAGQSPAYRMLMIKHLICRLHTYVRRPAKNFKQSIHDRWVRGCLTRRLRTVEQ